MLLPLPLLNLVAWLRARWELRGDQSGMTTETVILIAIFAGLAIAAGAIIVAKATNVDDHPI